MMENGRAKVGIRNENLEATNLLAISSFLQVLENLLVYLINRSIYYHVYAMLNGKKSSSKLFCSPSCPRSVTESIVLGVAEVFTFTF